LDDTQDLNAARIQKYNDEWETIKATSLWIDIAAWAEKKQAGYDSKCRKTMLSNQDAICDTTRAQGVLFFIEDLRSNIKLLITTGSTRRN
jgi:hypothetical protein